MSRTTQKTKIEKVSEKINAKYKADFNLVLYWHFQTVKEEWMED